MPCVLEVEYHDLSSWTFRSLHQESYQTLPLIPRMGTRGGPGSPAAVSGRPANDSQVLRKLPPPASGEPAFTQSMENIVYQCPVPMPYNPLVTCACDSLPFVLYPGPGSRGHMFLHKWGAPFGVVSQLYWCGSICIPVPVRV